MTSKTETKIQATIDPLWAANRIAELEDVINMVRPRLEWINRTCESSLGAKRAARKCLSHIKKAKVKKKVCGLCGA